MDIETTLSLPLKKQETWDFALNCICRMFCGICLYQGHLL